MSRKILSRREFLRLGAMAAGSALLAGCGGSSPASPAEAPQEGAAAQEEAPAAEAPAKENAQIRFASFDWFAMVPGIKWDQYNQEQAFATFKEEQPNVEILWEPHGDGWELPEIRHQPRMGVR